jgi:hypothetical protein
MVSMPQLETKPVAAETVMETIAFAEGVIDRRYGAAPRWDGWVAPNDAVA